MAVIFLTNPDPLFHLFILLVKSFSIGWFKSLSWIQTRIFVLAGSDRTEEMIVCFSIFFNKNKALKNEKCCFSMTIFYVAIEFTAVRVENIFADGL